jgi:hypothetical protein
MRLMLRITSTVMAILFIASLGSTTLSLGLAIESSIESIPWRVLAVSIYVAVLSCSIGVTADSLWKKTATKDAER